LLFAQLSETAVKNPASIPYLLNRTLIFIGDEMLCSLIITEGAGVARRNEPVALGLPFPRGMLTQTQQLALIDYRHNRRLPLQVEVLDRWVDGSVKWALLDFQATVAAGEIMEYNLQLSADGPLGQFPGIGLARSQHTWGIDTGVCRFTLNTHTLRLFDEVVSEGTVIGEDVGSQIALTSVGGQTYEPKIDHITVGAPGPLRLSLHMIGKLIAPDQDPLANFIARLSFYAGSGVVELQFTLHNPKAAKHPGGLWDLGDEGSIYFKDLSLHTVLHTHKAAAMWTAQPLEPVTSVEGAAVEIYQDSSGGRNWQSTNHVNAHGRVMPRFQGYRVQVGAMTVAAGKRASPAVLVYDPRDDRSITGALEGFWQNFPKALEVHDNRLTIGLFPRQYADVYELQGGEQKTQTLFLSFGRRQHHSTSLTWVHDRLVPRAQPEWYAESKAISYLTSQARDENRDCLALVDTAIAGPNSFFERREISDEFGWRHFGDLYADHEAIGHQGESPLNSHYNNQYDAIYGALIHFLRSGDVRWYRFMRDLARHVIDIDLYHTQEDRPAYNGGLFWHTDHYTDAATATHRSYSRAHRDARGGDRYGGGPSNEHNYTTGLLHYYFLTGDVLAREAVCCLADWVIEMDHDWRAPLGWFDRRPTGIASATASRQYHGPGRGAGNSINALIDVYLLTRDARYLATAEALIRRCIHPTDDIRARNLADVEHRWSYTVFLQVLGRYLDVKIEQSAIDYMYGYARESLLHYARWMLEHEVPYATILDRVEIPTETWPAQDIRKSNVFDFAAKHAHEPLRTAFLQKADFFFQACIRDLRSFDTCTLTRPLVLLMTNAFRHTYFQLHPDERAPCPDRPYNYGKPQHFTPHLAELYQAREWLGNLSQTVKDLGRRLVKPFPNG
jgi:YetA-like protein